MKSRKKGLLAFKQAKEPAKAWLPHGPYGVYGQNTDLT